MEKSAIAEACFPSHPRDYPIFRPRENECPYELLAISAGETVDLDVIRVAKHRDNVVAAYKYKRISALVFEIERLGVSVPYRHRGLGSWMLAHAIGIIESKGGREVIIQARLCHFLSRLGFEPMESNVVRLTLVAD